MIVRLISKPALTVAAVALIAATAACSSGTSASTGSGSSGAGTTLTYWASDQGSSISDDYTVLNPELAKFQRQTGIKVNLEVIGWPDLLNLIVAARTSGQGADVVNIGNTWSASLQASGALLPWTSEASSSIGGEGQFAVLAPRVDREAGKPPDAVPLYSVAYALYYNKALFQQAWIASRPPPGRS